MKRKGGGLVGRGLGRLSRSAGRKRVEVFVGRAPPGEKKVGVPCPHLREGATLMKARGQVLDVERERGGGGFHRLREEVWRFFAMRTWGCPFPF